MHGNYEGTWRELLADMAKLMGTLKDMQPKVEGLRALPAYEAPEPQPVPKFAPPQPHGMPMFLPVRQPVPPPEPEVPEEAVIPPFEEPGMLRIRPEWSKYAPKPSELLPSPPDLVEPHKPEFADPEPTPYAVVPVAAEKVEKLDPPQRPVLPALRC